MGRIPTTHETRHFHNVKSERVVRMRTHGWLRIHLLLSGIFKTSMAR